MTMVMEVMEVMEMMEVMMTTTVLITWEGRSSKLASPPMKFSSTSAARQQQQQQQQDKPYFLENGAPLKFSSVYAADQQGIFGFLCIVKTTSLQNTNLWG